MTTSFIEACKCGNLEEAKIIFQEQRRVPVDIHYKSDQTFRSACAQGHLEVAQWSDFLQKSTKAPPGWSTLETRWNPLLTFMLNQTMYLDGVVGIMVIFKLLNG